MAESTLTVPKEVKQAPKLLDRLQEAVRSRHYSRRTEQTYRQGVKREINSFLTHLAIKEKVSASTQNQALCALLFLYRHVIAREIGDLGEVIHARKPPRLPVVMTSQLRGHPKKVKEIHEQDLSEGWGRVQMPMPLLIGDGNGFSHRRNAGRTPRSVNKVDIMFMKQCFKES